MCSKFVEEKQPAGDLSFLRPHCNSAGNQSFWHRHLPVKPHFECHRHVCRAAPFAAAYCMAEEYCIRSLQERFKINHGPDANEDKQGEYLRMKSQRPRFVPEGGSSFPDPRFARCPTPRSSKSDRDQPLLIIETPVQFFSILLYKGAFKCLGPKPKSEGPRHQLWGGRFRTQGKLNHAETRTPGSRNRELITDN
jgi:hypothetical protein